MARRHLLAAGVGRDADDLPRLDVGAEAHRELGQPAEPLGAAAHSCHAAAAEERDVRAVAGDAVDVDVVAADHEVDVDRGAVDPRVLGRVGRRPVA